MRTLILSILTTFALGILYPAHGRDLEIYWIDVEGGAATLIVSPAGESLLVDTGWLGQNGRDAQRIADAAKMAGLTRIDMLLITHFHLDHVGGVPDLAKLIPISKYYDHGESIEAGTPQGAQLYEAYKATAGNKRVVLKPGDKIPLKGVDITVVSSNGEVISKPLNGSAPNVFCKDAQHKEPDTTENSRSAGFLLSYGNFKFLDLGDLTWDKEMSLACPVNKIGTVTLFQATHHGFSNGASGAPAFIWALKPQMVIVNDGARKGFSNAAYETISKIPGIEGIWQMHRSLTNDAAHNTADSMTANLEEGSADLGKWIQVTAMRNGSFTVTNSRNGFSKTYPARH